MKRDISNGNIQFDKKLVDLLSRINGGVLEIPDIDLVKGERDRRVDKVCMAISLLQQRFGQNLQLVPWSLLRFVGLTKFRYGIRSLAHLIDIIPPKFNLFDRLLTDDLQLPLASKKDLMGSSLAYHLIVDEEPEEILELWNDISVNRTLIRFKSIVEDATGAVG